MKTNQLFLLTGLVAVTLPACVQKDKKGVSEKPMNILYIMCDDHSYQTISAYDHRFIETPNIDRIANEGVRFTNSFVANSLSGPSRACLLTGKHSHKNGFTDNTKRFDGSQQTFPKLLQQAGYQTAVVGKWHLSYNRGRGCIHVLRPLPLRQGQPPQREQPRQGLRLQRGPPRAFPLPSQAQRQAPPP